MQSVQISSYGQKIPNFEFILIIKMISNFLIINYVFCFIACVIC